VANNGLTHVDAKSLLGVISVDTINNCNLEITGDKNQEGVSEYINRIKQFTL
jgi:phosphotransferase system HPr-like phosphotransfer protein